ncbi:hypothetical protein PEPTYR26121_01108 [Peptoniphilus tyrrelliae]|nr:hypothetical protein PEPTYR26121_01108 [Peptoniphilus tyrrelliae]
MYKLEKIKYNMITFTLVYWGKVGKIESTKYIHDIHWYEKAGNQYKIKLKHRKGK